MFLKSLIKYATGDNKQKIGETSGYKAYNKIESKIPVTQFKYTNAEYFKNATIFAEIKHFNILRILKIENENLKITTEQVIPLENIVNYKDLVFLKHCAYTVSKTILYLNQEYQISHNSLCLQNIFVTQKLNLVIGGFEKAAKSVLKYDNEDFKIILKKLNLPIKELREVPDDWKCDFFDELEKHFLEFERLKIDDKLEMLKAIQKYLMGTDFFKEKIFTKIILDFPRIKNEIPKFTKEYKTEAVKMILKNDLPNNFGLNMLFNILDPEIRTILLSTSINFNSKNISDTSIESILLGIKCKDMYLQELTLKFIEKNYRVLNINQKKNFIRACRFLNSSKLINNACDIIRKDVSESLNSEICKFIEYFIGKDDVKLCILTFLKDFYKIFSKKELCEKIGPILFVFMRKQELQNISFEILELIVAYLKKNKKDILEKEWNLNVFSTIFGSNKSLEETAINDFKEDFVVKDEEVEVKEDEKIDNEEWNNEW